MSTDPRGQRVKRTSKSGQGDVEKTNQVAIVPFALKELTMHSLTFYPLANADCCLMKLANGQFLLFDYANMRDPADDDDPRIDLSTTLRDELGERDGFDIVAFTHADHDHVCGMAEFFYLDHALRYQSNDRAKIDELWVPAAVIVEAGLEGDARVLQAEARHRLRKGYGIRVFSRPERLCEWFEDEGIELAARQHLITDAGQIVPGFFKTKQGIEFFVHSPFAERVDENDVIDRNDCSLVLQVTFAVDESEIRFLLAADTTWDNMVSMIGITRRYGNDDRLAWDVFKLPHHCSYLSLSAEKGRTVTKPEPEIAWLFEEQGAEGGIIVSTSAPIPTYDTDQPPHRQAANYYKGVLVDKNGEFTVTMEHPSEGRPEPLVIILDRQGARVKKQLSTGVMVVTSRPSPRVG